MSEQDIDKFLKEDGLDTKREKEIGQHIGYRYDVNLVPDYSRLTPFLKKYLEVMGWDDLNWLEDVHLGYEEGKPAVFDRNINGWVSVPAGHHTAIDYGVFGPDTDRGGIFDLAFVVFLCIGDIEQDIGVLRGRFGI